MSSICAISKERYLGKSWSYSGDYRFATKEAVVVLVTSELAAAMMSYPIAFVPVGDSYQLVGVQGIEPNANLQVSDQGKWVGTYLPKAYRMQPFRLVGTTEGGKALCIDESLASIGEASAGHAFFLENGDASPKLTEALNTLGEFEKEKAAMQPVCATFVELGLIDSWDIVMNKGAEQQRIQGLFKVNEARLNELTGEQLEKLRNVGGLVVAFCQLLSMQNMQKLAKQHLERQQAAQQTNETMQAFGLSTSSELLSFDNL